MSMTSEAMLQDLPEYSYTPFSGDNGFEIRVLRILPPAAGDPYIRCTVTAIPLGESHVCLSYCWGSPDHLKTIIINGCRFFVRNNLVRFLAKARETRRCEQLWIDAICIDQSNMDERSKQVQSMSLIYRQAQKVYIWLDPAPNFQSLGLDFDTIQILKSDRARYRKWPIPRVVRFLSNAYFTRLWIISEFTLARERVVWFENAEWSLDKILDLVDFRSVDYLLKRTGLTNHRYSRQRVDAIRRLLLGADCDGERHLLRVLQQVNGLTCMCEDPRDRLYGLLGLAKDADKFPVDYSESIYDLYVRILSNYKSVAGASQTIAQHFSLRDEDIISWLKANPSIIPRSKLFVVPKISLSNPSSGQELR